MRFELVIALEVAVQIKPAFSLPRNGVLYAGRLTVMQHGIAQGLTALPYAYDTEVVTGQAEGGDYLGRIVMDNQNPLASSSNISATSDSGSIWADLQRLPW